MDISGKKVLFLGDSITEGFCASKPENNFVNLFGKRTGARVRNYGIGGTSIARQTTVCKDQIWNLNYLDRVDMMEKDADLVVVFGGTNDFGHGTNVIGDADSRDEYTFTGAVRSLIERLKTKYRAAKIVFMTPLHRENENVLVNAFGDTRPPLSAYVDALKRVTEAFSLPVLDLYEISGIYPDDKENKKTWTVDGLHPNDKGMIRITDLLIDFLSNLD